jgi:hypothetical protein
MSDPLRAIVARQRRDVSLLHDVLADAIENAVRRHTAPGQPITHLDRLHIMREVDAALDVIYGRAPGDSDAALRDVVLRDTRAARLLPLDEAVKEWRSAMPTSLRERVEADARR